MSMVTDSGATELAGTRGLVRVALRLDRWRTAIWAVAVAGLTQVSVSGLSQVYSTPESLAGRAQLISSPAATALAGPGYGLDDYTVGAMTANELGLWLMIPVAIMALLTVTRHLRAAEEDGRLELVRSAPVGRDAPVVAGLVAAVVATVVVGGLTFLALLSTGLDAVGSLALTGGIVMVGLVFAGISAVASQLTAHARAASSLGMAALGVAFLLRAVGDVRGPESTSVLTWLSPFGWAQATRAYVDERFWPLAIGVVVAAVLVAVAFWLVGRRDLGTGLLAERLGRPRASARLSGMVALTLRRQSGAILVVGCRDRRHGRVHRAPGGRDRRLRGRRAAARADVPDRPERRRGVGLRALHGLPRGHGGRVRGDRRECGADRGDRDARRDRAGRPGVAGAVAGLAGGGRGGRGRGDHAGHRPADGPDRDRVAGRDAPSPQLVGATAVTLPAVGIVLGVAVVVMGVAPRAFGLVWAYVTYVGVVGLFAALLPDGSDVLSPFTYTPQLPAEADGLAARARARRRRGRAECGGARRVPAS